MELPEIRRNNLLQLFSDYVAGRMAEAPSQQITGLDREFAVVIQVHNTYFSGMKSGSRTIGDKLARQIETLLAKSRGWLDEQHDCAKPAELGKFLQLAEKAYLAAPHARKELTRLLRDAIKQQDKIISKNV